jgi:hypothetical protein
VRSVTACIASREERPTRSGRPADVKPRIGDRDAAARTSAHGIVGSLTPVARAGMRAPAAPYPDDGFLAGVPLASRLIDTATQWLHGQYRTGMEVLDLIISTGVPVTWDNLRPVAESVLASRGETTLIVSDLATRAAAAVLGAFRHTGISLGVAGPDPAPERVAGHMRSLRAVIRELAADVAWAGVTSHAAMPPHAERLPAGAGDAGRVRGRPESAPSGRAATELRGAIKTMHYGTVRLIPRINEQLGQTSAKVVSHSVI